MNARFHLAGTTSRRSAPKRQFRHAKIELFAILAQENEGDLRKRGILVDLAFLFARVFQRGFRKLRGIGETVAFHTFKVARHFAFLVARDRVQTVLNRFDIACA
jgi:hypothetical protein